MPSLRSALRTLIVTTSVPDFYLRRGVSKAARRLPSDLRGIIDAGGGHSPHRRLFASAPLYASFDLDPLAGPDIVASVTHMPFADSSVDVMVCTEVMEHVLDTHAMLSEIARVLNPGGHVILSVPLLWGVHDSVDLYRWTADGLSTLLCHFGLDPVIVAPRGGIFTTIGAMFAELPHQVLARDFRRLDRMGALARARVALALALQLALTPIAWLVAAFDVLDGRKYFTLGYVVLARKTVDNTATDG